jgi:lysophospholipase L1-like esterase
LLFQAAALLLFFLVLEGVSRLIAPRMAGDAMLAHPGSIEGLLRDGNNPTLQQYIDCRCADGGGCRLTGAFRNQSFPCAPAAGERRFLFLGESSVFGDRLADDETIPVETQSVLRARGFRVEAINGGVSGINMVDILQILKDLAPQTHPEAAILYTGHNETYPLHANRNDFAFAINFPHSRWTMPLYQHLASLRLGVFSYHHYKWRRRPFPARTSVADFVEEAARAATVDEGQFHRLQEHKRLTIVAACSHLERIIGYCQRSGVKMLVCLPTSNRLQPTISSIHGPDYLKNKIRWDQTARQLKAAMDEQNEPLALAVADELLQLDPHYALIYYIKGLTLIRLGRAAESRPFFDQMLEEIYVYKGIPEPEGAPPSLARALAETAAHAGVPVWDAGRAVRGGDNPENDLTLFQDFVHFRPAGTRKFGAALADYLEKEGWVK